MRKLTGLEAGQAPARPVQGLPGRGMKHDSAELHVAGTARYVDDLAQLPRTLHVAVGQSTVPHARIQAMHLDDVRSSPGVVDVITVADVPGQVDIGPVYPGDPVLAEQLVEYIGQPIFAVAAESFEAAHRAVQKAKIDYEPLPAVLDIEAALRQKLFVRPSYEMRYGDADAAIEQAPHQLNGQLYVSGQEHFYLEGQVSYALPTEDGGMLIHTSSQHPAEVQKLVAEVLGLAIHKVQVEVRRMGGGFGGKETQAAPLACIAAILAQRTRRPVKYRMARRDDMVMTGKRHDFLNRYRVGFDADGVLRGADMMVAGKCGYSPDLSDAIVDRAMFHADNAYSLGQVRVEGHRCKTHTVSNTAFRGFGGPQGMLAIECAMDDIARHLGLDPLDVRKCNLYREQADPDGRPRNITHYGQKVEDYRLPELIERLEQESEYRARRRAVVEFNRDSRCLKKGLALTPVKFGISFTKQHLNQAGALVHIYTDGSIHLNHGGTEMGQGLFVKVAQVVANEFQVDLDRVAVSATRTDKVPNASPTAASSGSDLNGMAARDACLRIKERLIAFAVSHFSAAEAEVRFHDNHVSIGDRMMTFEAFVQLAYFNRVSLSSTGFYRTPKIHFDRDKGEGRPFFYFATGAAVSEVLVDTLTGEYKVTRVDILQDVGASLNPAIDIGQIEGGFVQGMGWLTTEELKWDGEGRILSNSPANYKIPTAADVPEIFNVKLLEHRPNAEPTVYHSKAVGEPPLMLAISVWSALRDAVSSLADYRFSPPLDTPATPERVLWAVEAAQAFAAEQAELDV